MPLCKLILICLELFSIWVLITTNWLNYLQPVSRRQLIFFCAWLWTRTRRLELQNWLAEKNLLNSYWMCWNLIIYYCKWNVCDPLFKNFDVILQVSFNFLPKCTWGFLLNYELKRDLNCIIGFSIRQLSYLCWMRWSLIYYLKWNVPN
jgi:hypothetical protein